jgi:dihydrofolate reductase
MRPLSNSRILRRAAVGVFVLLSCVLCVPTDSGLSAPARVAVVFERGGDLYATSVDGSRTIRLTKTRVREWEPEVFSPTIGRQLLERGLIDEIDLHIAPVLLGDGIRLFDNPGGAPGLELLNGDDPTAAVNVRYHPVATT